MVEWNTNVYHDAGEARSLENLLGLMIHEGAHSWYQQMLATNESTKTLVR